MSFWSWLRDDEYYDKSGTFLEKFKRLFFKPKVFFVENRNITRLTAEKWSKMTADEKKNIIIITTNMREQ